MKTEHKLILNRLLRVIGLLQNSDNLLEAVFQNSMVRVVLKTGQDYFFDIDNFDLDLYKELLTKLK